MTEMGSDDSGSESDNNSVQSSNSRSSHSSDRSQHDSPNKQNGVKLDDSVQQNLSDSNSSPARDNNPDSLTGFVTKDKDIIAKEEDEVSKGSSNLSQKPDSEISPQIQERDHSPDQKENGTLLALKRETRSRSNSREPSSINGGSDRKSRSRSKTLEHKSKSRSNSVKREASPEKKSRHKRSQSRSVSRSKKSIRSRSKTKSRSRTRSPRRSSRSNRRRSRSPRKPRSRSRRRSRSRSHSHRRRRSRSRTPPEGARLHVSDLDVDTRKRDLEKLYEKYGKVREIWMARNPPCFAFVVFDRQRDADEALHDTNGMNLGHCRIKVTLARPRVRGGRFRGGRDRNLRCYQCGELGHFSRNCTDSEFGYKRPPSPPGHRSHKRARSRSLSRSRSRRRSRS